MPSVPVAEHEPLMPTSEDIRLAKQSGRVLAAQLGSDVPFALLGGTALGSGRGEHVVPVLARGGYHWVLAF